MANFKVKSIAAVVVYALLFKVSIFSGEGSVRITSTPPMKYVALTFDDGPHEGYTHRLLEILRKYNARATFFVVGKQVSKYPAYLRDIHRHGHEIANHTYTHPNLTKLSDDAVLRELDYTRYLVNRLTGQECVHFRPPGGRYNSNVLQTASNAGYNMILWSVFPQDHRDFTPYEIYKKVTDGVFDGGVVLLHSGRNPTIEALPQIILELRRRGYEFVTISDLIRRDRNTPNLYSFYKGYGSVGGLNF